MTPELDLISAADYLADLQTRPLAEVRAMRDSCQQHENAASYIRRLAQGRLDIVGGELARRRSGGDPGDLGDLVGRLPDLLSERGGHAVAGRPSLDLEPDSVVVKPLQDDLDAIVEMAHLTTINERSDRDLEVIAAALQDFEAAISSQRRMLHDRIDLLQAEITRRYRDGEASVDNLLQ